MMGLTKNIANKLKSTKSIDFIRLMSTQNINVAVNEKTGYATVTLQRKPVNGLNTALIKELNNCLLELNKSKCRGMILTSGIPKIFSAGLDITEMYKPTEDKLKDFWTNLQDLWLNLYGSAYPTAAAITGQAPAGGCLLSMSCEYRVMLPNFQIGLNETQLGLAAPTWFADSMLNVLGPRKTEAALTAGYMFPTEEALKVGLIDEIGTSNEDVLAKCEKFLDRFKRIAPEPRIFSKMAVRQPALNRLRNNLQKDLETFITLVTQPSTQKILGAYLQMLSKQKK